MDLEKLKFPIGHYTPEKAPPEALLSQWISDIETFPRKVAAVVQIATVPILNYKYRPNGWMVKQVVHHCADSHLNSIMRFKLALTEDNPTIRPYLEQRWAMLADSLDNNIQPSLQLLTALHTKWVILLRGLDHHLLNREYVHPEHGQVFNLAETIGSYAWHCNHHLAHIKQGLASNGVYN